MRYEIRLDDRLGDDPSDWFDGMQVTGGPDGTTIAGDVADQSALHGVLDRIRDLGLSVVSVTRVDPSDDGTDCGTHRGIDHHHTHCEHEEQT